MPVKQRRAKANPHAITPAVTEAYAARDRTSLHQLLHLPPWAPSPLDAAGECPWPAGSVGMQTWSLAQKLRAEIKEVADAR